MCCHGYRPACAFLNAGNGGTVYLGVKKTGIVHGIEISRKDVRILLFLFFLVEKALVGTGAGKFTSFDLNLGKFS